MSAFDHFTDRYFRQYIPEDSRSLVIDFFIVFSRFEYALKATGFTNGNEDGVSANWDTFAASIRGSFQADKTPELRTAVGYLHNSPPRKQILEGSGILGWAPRIPGDSLPLINELSLSIRTIRNNLFHGSKFQEILPEGHDRDRRLLRSSMIVLEECLRLAPNVRERFFSEIPDVLDAPPGEAIHA